MHNAAAAVTAADVDSPALESTAAPAAPTEAPPKELRVCLNKDPDLGFCVYAVTSFAKGQSILKERVALEATYAADERGIRNVYERYCKFNKERRQALHGSFPALAWANGVDPYEAAACRSRIASKLTVTRATDVKPTVHIDLSEADHIRMRPDGPALLGLSPPAAERSAMPAALASIRSTGRRTKASLTELFRLGESTERSRSSSRGRAGLRAAGRVASDVDSDDDAARSPTLTNVWKGRRRLPESPDRERDMARRETLRWFSRYGFRLPAGTEFNESRSNAAAIYLLIDLFNHRCAPVNNCRVQPMPGGYAELTATRDIAAGEELTINYDKNRKDFVCKGECCRKKT